MSRFDDGCALGASKSSLVSGHRSSGDGVFSV